MKPSISEQRFDAPIEEGRGGGAFVRLPFSVLEIFGTAGQIRVKGTVDGQPFESSVAPMGGGRHVLGLHKATRELIGKSIGDRVSIVLRPDLATRTVVVPGDFARALARNPAAAAVFEKFAYTHRKEYVRWVEEAKRPETRDRRIAQAIDRIARSITFS